MLETELFVVAISSENAFSTLCIMEVYELKYASGLDESKSTSCRDTVAESGDTQGKGRQVDLCSTPVQRSKGRYFTHLNTKAMLGKTGVKTEPWQGIWKSAEKKAEAVSSWPGLNIRVKKSLSSTANLRNDNCSCALLQTLSNHCHMFRVVVKNR